MALDRINKNNHASKKPLIDVKAGWLNYVIDYINSVFPTSRSLDLDTVTANELLGTQQRFSDYHDDMTGKVQSAQVGGTAWDIEAITGTSFVIGALKNNSSDLVQVTIQVPHRRKLGSPLDSVHLHYVLQSASQLNDTVIFTGKYCWINPGQAIPADGSWTAFTGSGLTLNLGAIKPVRYYGIHIIYPNIPAPAGEGYGGMLLVNITRGNGTYAGKFGVLDVDAHTIVNRFGSAYEISDTI